MSLDIISFYSYINWYMTLFTWGDWWCTFNDVILRRCPATIFAVKKQ